MSKSNIMRGYNPPKNLINANLANLSSSDFKVSKEQQKLLHKTHLSTLFYAVVHTIFSAVSIINNKAWVCALFIGVVYGFKAIQMKYLDISRNSYHNRYFRINNMWMVYTIPSLGSIILLLIAGYWSLAPLRMIKIAQWSIIIVNYYCYSLASFIVNKVIGSCNSKRRSAILYNNKTSITAVTASLIDVPLSTICFLIFCKTMVFSKALVITIPLRLITAFLTSRVSL